MHGTKELGFADYAGWTTPRPPYLALTAPACSMQSSSLLHLLSPTPPLRYGCAFACPQKNASGLDCMKKSSPFILIQSLFRWQGFCRKHYCSGWLPVNNTLL